MKTIQSYKNLHLKNIAFGLTIAAIISVIIAMHMPQGHDQRGWLLFARAAYINSISLWLMILAVGTWVLTAIVDILTHLLQQARKK